MRVALYARVSTTRQAEIDLSIPDQLNQMRDWCQAQGWTVAVEYAEPGASATDDRRPVFQQMVSEAGMQPPPFEVIVVYSLSRFFRDAIAFGLYERQLARNGVRVVSMTQQTSDDPGGMMVRRILSVFDEYQSQENGKHTLRAMRENARQGFFNGSKPPFGFKTIEVPGVGNRGKPKKKLFTEESEATLVRRIFALYLHGDQGRTMGLKEIAGYLNERKFWMRGNRWRVQKLHDLLSDPIYAGQGFFNRYDHKSRKIKPESEWVRFSVESIIDQATFDGVTRLRAQRSPRNTPPRAVSSPHLLTGLLWCGDCGAAMTVASGKSGGYLYYKCATRIAVSKDACHAANLSMPAFDRLILTTVAERLFVPERVAKLMAELREKLSHAKAQTQGALAGIQTMLKSTDAKLNRLYAAVEEGVIPLDGTLQQRIESLREQRESLLREMGQVSQRRELPMKQINQQQIEAFSRALTQKLLDSSSQFAKRYLSLLVNEIRVTGNTATVTGSWEALAHAIAGTKKGTPGEVPSFISEWRPTQSISDSEQERMNMAIDRKNQAKLPPLVFYSC